MTVRGKSERCNAPFRLSQSGAQRHAPTSDFSPQTKRKFQQKLCNLCLKLIIGWMCSFRGFRIGATLKPFHQPRFVHAVGWRSTWELEALKPIFAKLFSRSSLSCAHNTVPTTILPNNIDKLSFHARRVECNCNSVYTIFCFVHYGIGFVFGWNIWDGVEERGCGETRGEKRNAKTLMEKFLSSVAKAWNISLCLQLFFRSFPRYDTI